MFNCKFCDKESVLFLESEDKYKCTCCGKEKFFFVDIVENFV